MLTENNRRILVVRKVANTLRESCFATVKDLIYKIGIQDLFEINKTDMNIICKHTGSMMFFKGMDNPEKIKSTPTDNIICEECTELDGLEDFDELDTRLRGLCPYPMNIFLMFNPIQASNWTKKHFFDNPRDDAYVIQTTYKDNIFLDKKNQDTLEKFKFTNPYRYQVMCLGNWGTTGESFFDSEVLGSRLEFLKKKSLKLSNEIKLDEDGFPMTYRQGYFKYDYINERIIDNTIVFVDDPTGPIFIYGMPKKDYPYVIGGDTAGDSLGDYFACHCIDNTTGTNTAVLHQQTDETEFARQVYCLGKFYNYALVGLECNYSTYPVKEMQRLGYMNQFQRKIEDKVYVDLRESYGFLTNKLTRPIILSNLQEIIKETGASFLYHEKTIDELLTFVRNPKKNGRPEGDTGCHDDLPMSLAICMYIREQQRMKPKKPKQQSRRRNKNLLGY